MALCTVIITLMWWSDYYGKFGCYNNFGCCNGLASVVIVPVMILIAMVCDFHHCSDIGCYGDTSTLLFHAGPKHAQ